ncbi:tetratricopeptide repeat protein [uncultured Rothia sp.]|uniref:tetratricopeptide repeat protein n=1 Tax=uncultured Rothia sp. TaxID=316088 RepID=UPI003216F647
MVDIDHQLDEIFAARDRQNMEATIEAFTEIVKENPGHARALYELGGSYDTAGEEEQARIYYEKAREVGLDGPYLKRWYLQYGSTLRNTGELGKSLQIFDEAIEKYPESHAFRAFRAITLFSLERYGQAVGSLLKVIADTGGGEDIDRYRPALHGYGDYIQTLP